MILGPGHGPGPHFGGPRQGVWASYPASGHQNIGHYKGISDMALARYPLKMDLKIDQKVVFLPCFGPLLTRWL